MRVEIQWLCHRNVGPGQIGLGTKISAEKNGPPDHIFW